MTVFLQELIDGDWVTKATIEPSTDIFLEMGKALVTHDLPSKQNGHARKLRYLATPETRLLLDEEAIKQSRDTGQPPVLIPPGRHPWQTYFGWTYRNIPVECYR